MKTKFDFECYEVDILDGDLGFTIIFSESPTSADQYKSTDELINSNDQYLLIQLTYPEDDFESKYYYAENQNMGFELTEKFKLKLIVQHDKIRFENKKMMCEIKTKLIDKRKAELLDAVEKYFAGRIDI